MDTCSFQVTEIKIILHNSKDKNYMKRAELERRNRLKRMYKIDVERSIVYYNKLNQEQPVIYRKLSEEELTQITAPKSNYYKIKVEGHKK